MRLGADDIQISVGRETLFLRPTLRAAFRLEQKYNGFHNLYRAVEAGSLTAISDILREGSGRTSALSDYFDSPDAQPLMVDLRTIGAEVGNYLVSLTSVEGAEAASNGEPISYLDFHTRLFQIATGWLGWTPEIAWNATPAEIVEAQKGLLQKLKAVFGGGKTDDETLELNDPAARGQLNALGDLTVTTMPEVSLCA